RAHRDKDDLAIPKAPAQSIDVAVADFFEPAIEALVNSVEEPEDFSGKAVRTFLRTFRALFPVFLINLVFAAIMLAEPVGETRIDFLQMPAHQKFHHRRDDSAGEKIGGKHGKDDRHRQRLKKKLRHTTQMKDGHK